VINLSLGGPYSQTDCDAVSTAERTYGALIVAAAGNDASSAPVAPAGCAGAVGVAATTQADVPASFSNYGYPDVFVSAPGVAVYSSVWPDTYEAWSGTSMASPFVAGVASLRLGEYPSSTPADVRRVIASSSDKVGGVSYSTDPFNTCAGCTWQSSYGYGRVDVAAALAAAVPTTPPPPPPPAPPPMAVVPDPPPVAAVPDPEPEPEPEPMVVADVATAAEIFVRLSNGERVPAGSFESEGAAEQRARELMQALDGHGEWPRLDGRFIRPDAVVSIDVELA
jgi:subtilisin family serine protease